MVVVMKCRLFQTPTLLRGCPSSVQNVQSNIMWMIYTYTMYLWLWQRRDSSICTIFPGPPRMLWFWRSFIVHTYFSEPLDCTPIADILVISTSWAVPVTGYWLVHFWRDILNLEKNLPSSFLTFALRTFPALPISDVSWPFYHQYTTSGIILLHTVHSFGFVKAIYDFSWKW